MMWMRGGMMVGGDMMIAPGRGWWFGGGNTRWLAVDLTRPERPVFAGDYSLGEGARSVPSRSAVARSSPLRPAMSGCQQ